MSTVNFSQIFLVAMQFMSAATLVLSSSRESFGNTLALPLVIGGAALGAWSWGTFGLRRINVMPSIRTDAKLVTHGPYRFIRHPMYAAVLMFCGGFAISPLAWWRTGTWLVLLAVVWQKSRMEERLLTERFNEYSRYKNTTGRFIPLLPMPSLTRHK